MRYQNKKIGTILGVVLMLGAIGCRTSTWSSQNITGEPDVQATPAASLQPGQATPSPAAVPTAPVAEPQASTAPQKATPQQIMAEVRELGTVNPAAQAALMQELEKADPDIWPSVVQNFRSRLAYGDQLYQKELLASRDAQYVQENPRYGNQPIPTNAGYPQTNESQNQNVNLQQPYSTPQGVPQNIPQTGTPSYPTPSCPTPQPAPQNYSVPQSLPSPASVPMPVYPHTSSKLISSPISAGVIQASYEEEVDDEAEYGEIADRETTDERANDPETRIDKTVKNNDVLSDTLSEEAIDDSSETPLDQEAFAEMDWETSLNASIASLQKKLKEAETAGNSSDSVDVNGENAVQLRLDQLRLRFMLLAAGRSIEAMEPISGESEAMTDFWANEMFGLKTLLDEQKMADPALRNASAKYKLAEAIHQLGKESRLEVRNLAFCKSVNGFANVERFPTYEFKSSDQVILYAELDNLKHDETVDGYRTALEIGYKIFDSADHLVDSQQSSTSEECSPVLRRDYYVTQLIRLPERLYPGRHLLKLTVEDKLGQKYGESVIEFDVK